MVEHQVVALEVAGSSPVGHPRAPRRSIAVDGGYDVTSAQDCPEQPQQALYMRYRPYVLVGVLALSAGCLNSTPEMDANPGLSTEPSSEQDGYRVTYVVDGDTFDIDDNGETVRIRVIGIDTPEVYGPDAPQCYGEEASERAKELLENTTVTLENDPSQEAIDRYDRRLAHVVLSDGTQFGELMVKDGFAQAYTYRSPAKYDARYEELEAQARESRSGMWGSCD